MYSQFTKLLLMFLLVFSSLACSNKSWRDASRESAGIAPKASELKEHIYQVYYARAFSWRGYFGIHPWVAWKLKEEDQYSVAQVSAWAIRYAGQSVTISKELPDRYWFDSRPRLLYELRGEKAKRAIEKTKELSKTYPFLDVYRVWPGPNSNTYVAYLLRNIDELPIELPANAIGKDYFGSSKFFAPTASGTGFEFSLFGILGFDLGLEEGVEINILGIHFGIDFWTPALKLPIFGRLGFQDKPILEY